MADMIRRDYSTNWEAFVERVISLFNAGKSEAEISAEFGDVYVEWQGVVSEVKLSEEYAPGVAMAMNAELNPLKKGKVLRADYLFLNVEPQSASAWAGCKVGDRVSFRAKISKASGPFSEIQLSEFDGDPEVVLMVGLYECEFIAVV